jgi:hypothetical protein
MIFKAEIERGELERMISAALKSQHSAAFPNGAKIQWQVSDNQREGTHVKVIATPLSAPGKSWRD